MHLKNLKNLKKSCMESKERFETSLSAAILSKSSKIRHTGYIHIMNSFNTTLIQCMTFEAFLKFRAPVLEFQLVIPYSHSKTAGQMAVFKNLPKLLFNICTSQCTQCTPPIQ